MRQLLAFVLAGLASAVQASPGEELAKLTIGAVLPLSGPQAAFGAEAMRGFEMALDELRLKEPELATRISLISGDDQSTVKGAADAAAKLIDKDRVHLLIGSVTPQATVAMTTVARQHQLPLLVPIASQASVVTGGGIFRVAVGEAGTGDLLATFALKELGSPKIATLHEGGFSGAQATVDRFSAAFKSGGGTVVSQETYDVTSEDFSAALKHATAAGAKALVAPTSYRPAAELMRQAKKHSPGLRLLAGDSWDTPALSQLAGAAGAGHYFLAQFAADDPDPKVQDFVKAFQQKYGRAPGSVAALAYDTIGIAVDAFKRAHTNLKSSLTLALEKTKDLPGVTGALSYGEGGEPNKVGIIKETTEGGAKFKTRVGGASATPPTPQTETAKGEAKSPAAR